MHLTVKKIHVIRNKVNEITRYPKSEFINMLQWLRFSEALRYINENKMASEKYVLLYSRSFNINAIVLRLSNVYGPRAAIHSPNFTFNNYFIGQALQNKGVTVFKPGNQIRNSIFIDDVINAVIKVANTNLKPNIFQIVHDEHFTVKEIAEMTIEIFSLI